MSARFEQKQWTQTVRRGPIAAEIQTPAPNFVELPPLIGTCVLFCHYDFVSICLFCASVKSTE